MSNIANLKVRQGVAPSDIVITIDSTISCPRQMQFNCISGTIEIEGEGGDLFNNPSLPTNAIIVTAGQGFTFNEGQYKFAQITIKSGAEYQIITNQ